MGVVVARDARSYQLRKRFGELPDWVPSRLQQANPEQLEDWGERLLEVDSLDQLFDSR